MVDQRQRERGERKENAVLAFAENVVYVGIAVLLLVAAGVLLVVAADQLLDIRDGLGTEPIIEVLSYEQEAK